MSFADMIILAAVGAGLFFAVRGMVRRRRHGGCIGCSGNCAECGKNR